MNSKYRKPITVIFIVIAVLASAIVVKLYFADRDTPEGMRQVTSYEDQTGKEVSCQALMPECGVCPGEVINQKCYVKKGTYEQYE